MTENVNKTGLDQRYCGRCIHWEEEPELLETNSSFTPANLSVDRKASKESRESTGACTAFTNMLHMTERSDICTATKPMPLSAKEQDGFMNNPDNYMFELHPRFGN